MDNMLCCQIPRFATVFMKAILCDFSPSRVFLKSKYSTSRKHVQVINKNKSRCITEIEVAEEPEPEMVADKPLNRSKTNQQLNSRSAASHRIVRAPTTAHRTPVDDDDHHFTSGDDASHQQCDMREKRSLDQSNATYRVSKKHLMQYKALAERTGCQKRIS